MIQIVTIEREYGSGAAAIADELAQRLGWTVWDQDITRMIAARLKCDEKSVEQREERPDSAMYRLMKIFMRGSYEESFTGGGPQLLDAEHLATLFEGVVKEIAAKGRAIIVGRGAPWFLRGRKDTFRVFLYARREEKLRRLAASGSTPEEAEELIERVDRDRAAFVKRYHGNVWPQRSLYHLMINTELGNEMVTDTIVAMIEALDRQPITTAP